MERRVRALTPDDIVNYPLKQAVRGYSVRQVDDLLDRVADEFERVHHELAETRQRLVQAESRAEALSEAESTLKRTLVTAQRAAEQTVAEARERAATLVEQAQQEAERKHRAAVISARQELDELRRDQRELVTRIEALREFERDYRSTLRNFVERHLRTLDELQQRVPPSIPESEQNLEAVRAGPEGSGRGGQDVAGPEGAGREGQDVAGPEGAGREGQDVAGPEGAGREGRDVAGPEGAGRGGQKVESGADEQVAGSLAENIEEREADRLAGQEASSGLEPQDALTERVEAAGPPASEPAGEAPQLEPTLRSTVFSPVFDDERPEENGGAGSESRRRWPAVDLSRGEHLRRQVEAAFSQVLTGLDDHDEEKEEERGAIDTAAREEEDRETVVIIHQEPKRRASRLAEDGRSGEGA